MSYLNKTILIFGLGVSGRSVASFFEKRNVTRLGYDDRVDVRDFSFPVFQTIEEVPFNQIDLIAYSPGIPKHHPLFLEAKKRNILLVSETEIGVSHLNNDCIGITGTNGKSTVTTLITHLLNFARYPAIALGNIGVPITSKVDQLKNEIVVVELSSYQIDDMPFPFLDQGLLLNISEDHLDWYGSFDAYRASKFSMQACIKTEGRFVLQKDLKDHYKDQVYFPKVSLFEPHIKTKQAELQSYFNTLGSILKYNFAAAYEVLKPYEIDDKILLEGLKSFKGLSHRIEEIEKIDGRTFINDSKATNLDAVIHALESFKGSIRLLMGGKDKGLDFSPLVPYVKSKVKKIYAIGEVQDQIASQLSCAVSVDCLTHLDKAIEKAWEESQYGDVVLLSPGTSSLDQFKNFEHRGNEFKRLVCQLKGVYL